MAGQVQVLEQIENDAQVFFRLRTDSRDDGTLRDFVLRQQVAAHDEVTVSAAEDGDHE